PAPSSRRRGDDSLDSRRPCLPLAGHEGPCPPSRPRGQDPRRPRRPLPAVPPAGDRTVGARAGRRRSAMTATRISCPNASKSLGRPLGATAVAIRDGVHTFTGEFDRMTVRQIFYKLSTLHVVEKSDG